MTPEIFQLISIGFQALLTFGVGTLVVLGFRFGNWKGRVDEQLAANKEDHKRYTAALIGGGD